MSESATQESCKDAALDYAARGWPVFPLHTIIEGKCSCRKVNCGSPGKHPYGKLAPQGVKNATTDKKIIKRWWEAFPLANVAIATGSASGIVVLDLDVGAGKNGIETAKAKFGWEIDGPYQLTGGGGLQAFYAHPGHPVKNRTDTGAVAEGVELKGDGGYVVAPPSLHISGKRYEWKDDPDSGPLPALLPWATEPASRPTGVEPTRAHEGSADFAKLLEGGIAEGAGRNVAAAKLAGHYFGKGLPRSEVDIIMRDWNSRNDPPMSDAELEKTITSIAKRHLISRDESPSLPVPENLSPDEKDNWLTVINEKLGVSIIRLRIIAGDEPMLEITNKPNAIVTIPVGHLHQKGAVCSAFLKVANVLPTIPGKKSKPSYKTLIDGMLAIAEKVNAAGEDSTSAGQVKIWLSEYLRSNPPVDADQCNDQHDPIIRENSIYIHMPSLARYARMRYDYRMGGHQFAQELVRLGFTRRFFKIHLRNGTAISARLYRVPDDLYAADQVDVAIEIAGAEDDAKSDNSVGLSKGEFDAPPF